MRVTNERAQSAIKAHHITGNLTNIVKDYAADLLEARELINEMRSFIEMLETLNSKEFNEHVRLIEKSKEYAE